MQNEDGLWKFRRYFIRIAWIALVFLLSASRSSWSRVYPEHFGDTRDLYNDFFAGFKRVEYSLKYGDSVDVGQIENYIHKIKVDNKFSAIKDKDIKNKYFELEELLMIYANISSDLVDGKAIEEDFLLQVEENIQDALGTNISFLMQYTKYKEKRTLFGFF